MSAGILFGLFILRSALAARTQRGIGAWKWLVVQNIDPAYACQPQMSAALDGIVTPHSSPFKVLICCSHVPAPDPAFRMMKSLLHLPQPQGWCRGGVPDDGGDRRAQGQGDRAAAAHGRAAAVRARQQRQEGRSTGGALSARRPRWCLICHAPSSLASAQAVGTPCVSRSRSVSSTACGVQQGWQLCSADSPLS